MLTSPFWWVVIGGLIAAGLIAAWQLWVPVLRRKEDLIERDPDLVEMVLALQRQVKLIQGRLNSLAPPREGTGKLEQPEAPLTRAELLRRIQRGGS